jgi:peptide-methionine (S)-S-oxide reductase
MWRALAVLSLLPGIAAAPKSAARPAPASAVFAGGCFWGVDAVFKHVKGVVHVVSGYAGGDAVQPSYGQVSTGATGHAESVEVTYDSTQVSYDQLLQVFFLVAHDPTQLDRQGPDEGTQYRSVVFYATPEQHRAAAAAIAGLSRQHVYPDPIVTQVVPLKAFYPAEAYHQNYLALHPDQPYIVYNDLPKLKRLAERFPALYQP